MFYHLESDEIDAVVNGVSGKIVISIWHTGNSVALYLCNQSDKDIELRLDYDDTQQFITSLKVGFGQLKRDRFWTEFITSNETTEIRAYAEGFPEYVIKAWFNQEQIGKIADALSNVKPRA